MVKDKQIESALQSIAYQKVYNQYPKLRGRIFAINNNSENKIKGAINKAMGTYEGVSDMCFILDNGKTAWVEWKTDTGLQSKAQKEWQSLIENYGHDYFIVRSEDDFFKLVYDLFKLNPIQTKL